MNPVKKYLPSNGTEGAMFIEHWCCKCARDKQMGQGVDFDECEDSELCDILTRSFLSHVDEWIYGENDIPCCTEFIDSSEQLATKRDDMTIDMFYSILTRSR